jgi:hypothetical protein
MTTFIRNCFFAFKCDKKWENLTQTKRTEVRFCDSCHREVFFCKTNEQLRESIVMNRCVAIEFEDPATKKITQLTGSPVRNNDDDDDF